MEVKKTTVEKVRELAQPIADELGFFLWDVRFEKEGATWYLRVLIDKDGGIDHLLPPSPHPHHHANSVP